MKGTLTSITMKQGNTNGRNWKLYTYKLDNGKSFTAFKKFNVTEGDYVDVINENVNGKWKVKDIKKIQKPQQPQQQYSSSNSDRELYIQRQSSLKVAVDIVKDNLDLNRVIEIADLLVEFCQNGKSDKLEEALSSMLLEDIGDTEEGGNENNNEDDIEGAL